MHRAARALLIWSICLNVLLLGLSAALRWQLRTATGLNRVVFQDLGFSGEVLDRATARTVDLDLLEENPSLPRQLFSIRWSGIWHVPRQGVYELFLGADDRARLTIDGQLVLQRGLGLGMQTTSETLSLDAGFHSIGVEYEQERRGAHLNLQWASAGRTPAPLDPYALFPTEPTMATLRLSLLAKAVRRPAGLAWLVLLGALVWRWTLSMTPR